MNKTQAIAHGIPAYEIELAIRYHPSVERVPG